MTPLRTLSYLLLAFLFAAQLTANAQAVRQGPRIRTIIIDPGHGGTDQGARGRYSTEAQLTLKLSLKLEQVLRNSLPETRIVMTRTTDVFNHVKEKADIANREKGDLFVCVHVNAAPPVKHREFQHYKTVTYYKGKGSKRKKYTRKEPVYRTWTSPNPAYGTSTYVFAADRSSQKAEEFLEQPRFESDAEVMDIPDPESTEAKIMAHLWSQKYFKNSVKLGSFIEEEFVKAGRRSWGVLQRNHMGIWVLQATNMPAVLVETGYITNEEEEDYLNSEEGQAQIVQSIANGVIRYKSQLENGLPARNDSLPPVKATPGAGK
jgi:N-acetylmuramoyl-L-alanine amidase